MSTSFNSTLYKKHLVSFSLTDALFRGIAISANAIFFAILYKNKISVLDSIFLSTFFHFFLNFIFEIPTSIIADLFGHSKILKIAFFLKTLSTLSFIFFLYNSDHHSIALFFLVMESLFDSLSNSFLSGSYQAAYLKKLLADGILVNSFFIDSLKYSALLRFIIPAGLIASISVSPDYIRDQSFYLLYAILLLRFVLLIKVFFDFRKGELNTDTQTSKKESVKSILISALTSIKKNPHIFIKLSFFSYISSIVFYILPNIQNFLRDDHDFMLKSTSVTFGFYIFATIFSINYSNNPNLKSYLKKERIDFYLNLSLLLLFVSLSMFADSSLVTYLVFFSTFSIYLLGFLGSRLVLDQTSIMAKEKDYATTLSISEMIAMLIFCLPATLNFFFNFSHFVIYLTVYTLVINYFIGLYERRKITA